MHILIIIIIDNNLNGYLGLNTNKNHWYDGWFYDRMIAPNQDTLFAQILDIIEKHKTIIDIGTGTGRFPFQAAVKSGFITGIDLSERNINMAVKTLSKRGDKNILFEHASINEVIKSGRHFDYAVMTYVIHEVDEDQRIELLKESAEVADKVIIGDYLVPKPIGFWSILNEIVEFAAGSRHYRNYKNYTANGGIHYLAEKAGLKIISEIKNRPSTSHLVVLEKLNGKNANQ